MPVEAYPLSWPEGWKRENGSESSKFRQPGGKAFDLLLKEVERLGGTQVIVSTNVPLRADGKVRQDREPLDPGVAVYFTRNKKPMVFACDRYDLLRDNVMSVAKTIEALRGIERWGASNMMERAFSGFKALSSVAASAPDWWVVLEIERDAPVDVIEAAYRKQARLAHPDVAGGSSEWMTQVNTARDQALAERRRQP